MITTVKIIPNKRIIILAIIMVSVGLGGFFSGKYTQRGKDLASFNAIRPIREKENPYALINPLLGYSIPSDISIGEYNPLLKKVQSVIDKAERQKDIDDVSVYFRNLNTSHWFGINTTREYYPASLLKVPLMIAYLKKADHDPNIMKHRLVVKPLPVEQSTEFDIPSGLTPNKAYSVFKLIQAMISESDNGAMITLFSYLLSIDPGALNDVYDNLGVQKPDDNSSAEYQMAVRPTGWFFRILYNATYISSEASEEALKLLSNVTFKDGIVAGVPEGITIAHKYGEHIITDGTLVTGVQIHDCGIVYAKENPYLLCIMTQTKSEAASKNIIREISRTIYQDIAK